MVRPSVRTAVISSSEIRTVVMSGSGTAAVFGPGIAHDSMMCGNDATDLGSTRGRESAIRGQCQRFEPEFARGAVALYMKVHRLAPVEAVEEEPVRSGDVDRGHQVFRSRVVIVRRC
jgi:hypothetical protein